MREIKSLGLKPQYEGPSSWWEHVPIAHFLIEYIKPDVVVELGSHYGVSLFSFCEAAKEYSPSTFVHGIDSWKGDVQAGYYGDEVYEVVKAHRDKFHKNRCQLIRSMFSDAAESFGDKSIDLIHIDGLHTYEAVKNDYETWFPKLKENGTILFHDWNERQPGFGVWKLWEEIKNAKEFYFVEIPNGHGLAIATKSKTKPEWHDILESNKILLQTKGILLEENQRIKEELAEKKKEQIIAKKHSQNLENIIKEQKESILILNNHLGQIRKEGLNIKILKRARTMAKKIFLRF